jgi:hypothetical protein
MMNTHKFLHELVKEQEWNARLQDLLESDPWRYSSPPPPPFTGNINTQEQRDLGERYG